MKWPFQRGHKAQARDKPGVRVRSRDLKMINRPRADRTMEGNEAIYAAVSRISNTIASMPMHLYRGFKIQEDHPLERIVSLEPHPNFSAFSWKQTMEALKNTEGTAYALRVLNSMGQLMRLDILNPTRVTPKKDEDGNIWYGVVMDDGREALAPGFLIICIKHMSANGIKGIRPIDVLRKSLDYDTQVKEMSLDQLEGVNHGVMLTVPNVGLSQAQKDEAVNRFLDTYEKSGRSVVILEGGMTATNFSASAVDSQLLDVERITRNRVATVYNLPPHLLGDYTDAAPGSVEANVRSARAQQISRLLVVFLIEPSSCKILDTDPLTDSSASVPVPGEKCHPRRASPLWIGAAWPHPASFGDPFDSNPANHYGGQCRGFLSKSPRKPSGKPRSDLNMPIS